MYGYDTEKLKRALDGLRIHELRELGGIVGVRSPSSQNFGVLRDSIIDIVTGRTGAEQKSSRGRGRTPLPEASRWVPHLSVRA